jgi:tryptophan synthase alpha chain
VTPAGTPIGTSTGVPTGTRAGTLQREPGVLEATLRRARDAGRKLVVPYVTGGLGQRWWEVVAAVAAAGADAVEIGIPFSDPIMDGPTIQEASTRALSAGATPAGLLAELRHLHAGVPLVAMTYYNLVLRAGHERFARWLTEAGVVGAIVPDLPLDEAGPWAEDAAVHGVENVLLAAPTTPDERLRRICEATRGFVYGVGLLGVTGERDALAQSAMVMGDRLKAATDKPVLIGVGVSTPDQARALCEHADGVVVGSALVRRLLAGGGPEEAASVVADLRRALDG